jgi:hypothetical protein
VTESHSRLAVHVVGDANLSLCNVSPSWDRLVVVRRSHAPVIFVGAMLLGACTGGSHPDRSESPTSAAPPPRSSISVRVVSSANHFGRQYGGPVATHVLAVRSDGLRVLMRTAANGRASIEVAPGTYLLSASYPACETERVRIGAGQHVFARLGCALP